MQMMSLEADQNKRKFERSSEQHEQSINEQMHCGNHEYEQVCFVNIIESQQTLLNEGLNKNSTLLKVPAEREQQQQFQEEHSSGDNDSSNSLTDKEDLFQQDASNNFSFQQSIFQTSQYPKNNHKNTSNNNNNNLMSSRLNKDSSSNVNLKNFSTTTNTSVLANNNLFPPITAANVPSSPQRVQSKRFLCAECLCEIESIDKKQLIPLKKLIRNQNKLYSNWPPLEGNLNSKVYSVLSNNEMNQHAYLTEIDRTCSELISEFSQLIGQLKKDIMRIEGDRFQTLQQLEELYNEIADLPTFNAIVTQNTVQDINGAAATASSINGYLNEKMNSVNNELNASSVDPNSNSTNQLLQQHKDAVENIMNNNNPDKLGSNLIEEQLNNLHINPQDNPASLLDIEEFLEQKYSQKKENSSKLEAILSSLEKFKPLEENLQGLRELGSSLQAKLAAFSSSIRYRQNNLQIQMLQSSFKSSRHLVVSKNFSNQVTIHTEGQVWGQVYSDFILENNIMYTFKFQFEEEVQNFIIIGLILDSYKDQISQGSSLNHFGKIFGQENNTYCGQLVKGTSQLSFLKKNDIIIMECCISNNHLTFSDATRSCVTTLHKDYSLNPAGKYRLCIEFYDFDEENTITILEAKSQ